MGLYEFYDWGKFRNFIMDMHATLWDFTNFTFAEVTDLQSDYLNYFRLGVSDLLLVRIELHFFAFDYLDWLFQPYGFKSFRVWS